MVQLGQAAKHGGAVLRVVMRYHLAGGLVVGNHAGGRRVDADAQRLAVDFDLVAPLHALADVRWLVVDRNAAFGDKLLHL